MRPRLVLVHGFTQNSRCWAPVDEMLAEDHEVVTVDLPGHGRSREQPTDLWGAAEAVAAEGGTGGYLGYSLGGRVCLHLALRHPELVERLVLVGAHPGMADRAERAQRAADDDAMAEHLEQIGVDAFLTEWLAQPLFASLTDETAHVAERRTNTAAGLAASLRMTGTGRQEPLWDRLGELSMPVLLVAGQLDVRFSELARRAADAIGPNATVVEIEGAGHAAHLERPEAFVEAVRSWEDNES